MLMMATTMTTTTMVIMMYDNYNDIYYKKLRQKYKHITQGISAIQ